MPSAAQRVIKLETVYGATAFERWMKTATEDELQAEIDRLDQRAREVLAAHGIDHAGRSCLQLFELAEEHGLMRDD